jgi:amino acid permease
MKLNVPITGFLIGLVLPFLGMFVVYLVWRGNMGLGQFATYLVHQKGMAAKVVLLGVLINLIPFVYFNLKKLDYAMRGIFIITMIYAMFIVLLRFVW